MKMNSLVATAVGGLTTAVNLACTQPLQPEDGQRRTHKYDPIQGPS